MIAGSDLMALATSATVDSEMVFLTWPMASASIARTVT